eukprot:15457503-Alexandrium_andersonii.AAC.1
MPADLPVVRRRRGRSWGQQRPSPGRWPRWVSQAAVDATGPEKEAWGSRDCNAPLTALDPYS